MEQVREDRQFEFDFSPLANTKKRSFCPTCKKSIKFFCYNCMSVTNITFPLARLPIPLVILKDRREWNSKSTAIHAVLLAPSDTTLVTIDRSQDDMKEFQKSIDPFSSVVLFPAPNSIPVEQVDWNSIKKVIVIDGTWSQASSLNKLLGIKVLKRVRLSNNHRTLFWRYQNLGTSCLSTIEAIYHLYREIIDINNDLPVQNLHNLLYLFKYFYNLIQKSYSSEGSKRFTSKHIPGYIKK
jgi:DTW domain-containing protein YfiP